MTKTTNPLWSAPVLAGPVNASVVIPGSKSITNRALLLAALSDDPSTIRRPLQARDTRLMADALRALGTDIREESETWVVTPGPFRAARIDVGNAGTVMRFVPPLAALAHGIVEFRGDPRAGERPVGEVLQALRSLGVDVRGDAVPFAVQGSRSVRGGRVVIDASASSQFVSALLLTGARYEQGIEVIHDGPTVPSKPHIDLTVAMLAAAGVMVDTDTADRWAIAPSNIIAHDLTVEPDLSNAAPFLAAAMVTGGTVTIADWPTLTDQAGDALRTLFAQMGGTFTFVPGGLEITGPKTGSLVGLNADLHHVGELTPVIAAVCALATTSSTLSGIAHLRLHETDRLAALANELGACGARVTVLEDGLHIDPAPLRGTVFRTYDDHRLATAAAVVGLVVPGVLVENVATTEKTMPGFVDLWLKIVEGSPNDGHEYRT